jgi:hypothetical protein
MKITTDPIINRIDPAAPDDCIGAVPNVWREIVTPPISQATLNDLLIFCNTAGKGGESYLNNGLGSQRL